MTERDLTANNGVIAKELDGTGWYWERMPDMTGSHRNTVGFDGLLCRAPGVAIRTEVKVGGGRLTDSEDAELGRCVERGDVYVVLRCHGHCWTLEPHGHVREASIWGGSLAECVGLLERRVLR